MIGRTVNGPPFLSLMIKGIDAIMSGMLFPKLFRKKKK